MQYSEGYLLDNRYELKSFIGSGTFGEVWVATDKATDLEIAIKVYVSMDEKGLQEFKKEFQISFELNHTNLLHANYLGVNPEDNRPFLVMPFCPDGSVSKFAGDMSEDDLWLFVRDVASGLAYLHSKQPPIIHQDIKPDNILILKNGDFVITDFGISKQLRATLRKSAKSLNSAGAISYMGPERFSKQYQAVKASDIWSLGVSIFELATNELPFCGMGGSMQKQGADMPELPEDFSPTLNMVCQSCMAKQPWDRPTAQQLADFATKYLNGESPRPTWKSAENFDPIESPVQQQASSPQPASQVSSVNPATPSSNAMQQTVRQIDNIPMAPSAPVTPVPMENVFGVQEEKKQSSISPLAWIFVAVVGLASGFLLSLFM
ncbi:MAG: serine/threonine-protein kinase [Bacteroidales bacterium]|nr:serine/threonine-protein kinase [Bacteroidales bacterium]